MIVDCVRAELFKLRRRPATWVLSGIYVLVVLLFNYVFLYALVRSGQMEQAAPGQNGEELIASLLPDHLGVSIVQSGASFGAAIALILGALAVGNEYSWGTVKTVATQRPGRGVIATGRMLSLAIVTLMLSVLAGLASAAASFGIAAAESADASAPGLGTLVLAVGAAWLLLCVWAALGAGLATLFRGTGLAIGIGLVWLLVVESLFGALPLPERASEVVGRILIGPNATSLASGFGELSTFGGVGAPPATATQAAIALGIYLVVFTAVAVVPYMTREIR